jgi:uncharacterized protein (DUF952 family)
MTTLWHLAETADWVQAQAEGSYARSTRGASLAGVGFIHCSAPEQLPRVVSVVYADATGDYVILEMDREHLESTGLRVPDEPGDPGNPASEQFPHVYGPIPVAAVTLVLPARVDHGVLTIDPVNG